MKEIKEEKDNLKMGARQSGFAFFLLIVLYLFLSLIFGVVLPTFSEENALYYSISFSVSCIAIIAVLIFFARKRKSNLLKITKISKFNPCYLILSVMLSFGMLFGFGFINEKFAELIQSLGLKVSGANIAINNFRELILYCVFGALFPALFEEMFFRGLLFGNIKDNRDFSSHNFLAIIAISLCFALYHCSITQFFYQFIYSCFLIVIVVASGSIIPSILTHFLNNIFVMIVTYMELEINLLNPLTLVMGIIAVCIVVCVCIYVLSRRKEENNIETDNQISLKQFWIPFGILGSVLCLIIIIFALF